MASIKKMAVGRKDTFMMCPSDIKIKPDWNIRNPKETDEDIINLSKSIAKRGVIEAITIDSDFFLTDGHRTPEIVRCWSRYKKRGRDKGHTMRC